MEVAERGGGSQFDRGVNAMLQWGRDLEVAERTRDLYAGWLTMVLQWGRDLEVAESRFVRFFAMQAPALQWGRDLEVAER